MEVHCNVDFQSPEPKVVWPVACTLAHTTRRDQIPPEGELTLGMTLSVLLNARLELGHAQMPSATQARNPTS